MDIKALIFADRIGAEMVPLNERTCPAMLPVAGKPLIEHTIESLAAARIKNAVVVVSRYSDAVKKHLGDGARWGMELEYNLSRGEESPAVIFGRFTPSAEEPLLALRGDILRSPVVKEFITKSESESATVIQASIGGKNCGVVLIRCNPAPDDNLGIAWHTDAGLERLAPSKCTIDFDEAGLSLINSLKAFHQANLDVVAKRIKGITLWVRTIGSNLMLGRASRMAHTSVKSGPVFVGARCNVHPSAELHEGSVLSEHVIVDEQASIKNSVVLPDTYVGQMTTLENAIVWGNELIDVETGFVTRVTDSFLLAPLDTGTLGTGVANALSQVAGTGLLLLSTPFWPLAAVLALLCNPSKPVERRTVVGNRPIIDNQGQPSTATISCWEWNVPVPLLRNMPKLLPVLTGDIRMIGTSLLSPVDAATRSEEWEFVRDKAPTGLFNLFWLQNRPQASLKERLMSDAFYSSNRSTGQDFAMLMKGITRPLYPSSWIGHKHNQSGLSERST